MSVAAYPHISTDPDGTARISDTRYKVIHLAGEHYYYGWTAEELLRQHTDLRPVEVYAALAWFYDHYDKVVATLKTNATKIEALREAQPISRAELLARRQ